jgi:probable phosphoglycerate mutase
MTLRLLLIRHGETEWNSLRRIQGRLDIPLNEVGRGQARAVAKRLGATPVAAVYTSDLARSSQTAEPIAAACGVAARVDLRLRERHFGRLQGCYYEELQKSDPERHRRMQARDLDFDLDGGETLPDLHRRVIEALDDIAARHPEGTVVVVTHGGVLDCAYRLATGLALDAPRTYGLFNASVNTLEVDGGGYRLVDWGDVAHLGAPADEIDTRLLN